MAKHSPHIIKGAPYIPFELYEEHLARKDAALRMAVETIEDLIVQDDSCPFCDWIIRDYTSPHSPTCPAAKALAACHAELEGTK